MAMLVLCLGVDSQHVCDYSNSSSCLLLMLFYAIKQLLRVSYLGLVIGLLREISLGCFTYNAIQYSTEYFYGVRYSGNLSSMDSRSAS